MTGEVYKKINITIDILRKAGERKKLIGIIHCPNEIMGFHHSWLGDENFIKDKINSWAHLEFTNKNSIENIQKCLENNKSIIDGLQMEKDENIIMLQSVQKNMHKYGKYII